MHMHLPSISLLPQPTKTTSSGEVVNYLSIESLASVSELRLTVDATKGQHPAYVIAEDEPIGDDTVSLRRQK